MQTLESRKLSILVATFESRLEQVLKLNERALSEDGTPSLEAAEAIEMLTNTYLEPLDHRITPNLESDAKTRLSASLEAIKETIERLTGLVKDAAKGEANIKKVIEMAEEMDETFLKAGWIKEQELHYDRVSIGALAAVFRRGGKLEDGILADIKDDLAVLKRLINQVTSDVTDYVKAASAEGEDKKLPPTPAENFSEKDYIFLGATNKEDFVIKDDDGKVFNLNWALDLSEVDDAPKDIPALGHDDMGEFSNVFKQLVEMYHKVVRALTDDKNESLKDKDVRFTTDGLLSLQAHLENLISAVHAYLFASVEKKAKDDDKKEEKEDDKAKESDSE